MFKPYEGNLLGRLILLAALFAFGIAPAAADPTRISVEQFSKDPKKVAALKKGIASMRVKSTAAPTSPAFRTSFAYWANTHGYFGTGTYATNLEAYIKYRMPQCQGAYTNATCNAYYAHMKNVAVPDDGFTDQIWGTCQHSPRPPDPPNYFFLPWHRLYLHYFERTLRKQSGDPDFALPYWNYYDNYVPSSQGICLPPLVRGTAAGTLYNQYRTPGLNQEPNLVFMDPSDADATQAFQYQDFAGFSQHLEQQPHGAMHCAAGSGCTMPDIGFVPIAGNDPVFYLHHANIDRLWQCWMTRKANGHAIDLAWAKENLGMPDSWFEKTFSFVDEDGKKVTNSVADLFNGTITVSYDNLTDCDAKPTTGLQARVAQPAASTSAFKGGAPTGSQKPVTLGNDNVDVPLQPVPAVQAEGLTANAAPQGEPGQSYLILEDVKLTGSPALTYKVFISSKSKGGQPSYIATLSYFNLGPAHHGHNGDPNTLGTLTYKITANLAQLGITSADDVVVHFEPTDLMVGTKRKKQAAGNGVVVSDIRLQTVPATQ